jgi:hypothetical protein
MVEFMVWKIELQNMLMCIKLQVMNDMSLSEVLDCVQHLQGKALDRNPDEFYFAMQRQETKDGVHIARYAMPHFSMPCQHHFNFA